MVNVQCSMFNGLQEIYPVGGIAEEDLETVLVLWEKFEVFLRDLGADVFFLAWFDECNASTLETGSTESATDDAIHSSHDLIEGDEFG